MRDGASKGRRAVRPSGASRVASSGDSPGVGRVKSSGKSGRSGRVGAGSAKRAVILAPETETLGAVSDAGRRGSRPASCRGRAAVEWASMRRALALVTLVIALASLAGSAGALRCACCVPGSEAAIKTADLCCPSDDASPCASQALKPSSASPWTLAEAPRPDLLPAVAVAPACAIDRLELQAMAARPSGRDGLALRSTLRI